MPVLTAPLFEPLTQGYGHDALPAAAAALENDGTRPFTIIGARVNGNRANCFTVTARSPYLNENAGRGTSPAWTNPAAIAATRKTTVLFIFIDHCPFKNLPMPSS